jgi:hypothetical protein
MLQYPFYTILFTNIPGSTPASLSPIGVAVDVIETMAGRQLIPYSGFCWMFGVTGNR